MKYAYARVSTRKQSREGNGLEDQIARLRAEGFDELVVDEFSASTNKRPKLEELLAKLQNGETSKRRNFKTAIL